jgi:secondary thiamine-phosphate synthase enzyme
VPSGSGGRSDFRSSEKDRIVIAVTVHQQMLEVRTGGRGFTDLTEQIAAVMRASGVRTGLCTVFVQHTSASLTIQENADPAVLRDLGRWLADLAPESRAWEHDDEGPDDMPAHARSVLTRTSESIPVTGGRLGLGTWQAVYLWEHRSRPHTRRIIVHVSGE